MEISLKNNIVILDEAHNIEDSARGAASWQVNQSQVRDSMQDLEKMGKFYRETGNGDSEPYWILAKLASQLSTWIDEAKKDTIDRYGFTLNVTNNNFKKKFHKIFEKMIDKF